MEGMRRTAGNFNLRITKHKPWNYNCFYWIFKEVLPNPNKSEEISTIRYSSDIVSTTKRFLLAQRLFYVIKFGLVIKKQRENTRYFKKFIPLSACLKVLYYKGTKLMIKIFAESVKILLVKH